MENNLLGKHYESVKTGDVVTVVAVGEESVTVQFVDGATKDITESTLKRWYKAAKLGAVAPVEPPVELEEEIIPVSEPELGIEENPAANDGVPPITEPKSDKKPKIAEGIKTAQAWVEKEAKKLGIEVQFKDRFVLVDGKKVMALFPEGVAVRTNVAKTLGIPAEYKKYNHPFQARIQLEKGVVEIILAHVTKSTEAK